MTLNNTHRQVFTKRELDAAGTITRALQHVKWSVSSDGPQKGSESALQRRPRLRERAGAEQHLEFGS